MRSGAPTIGMGDFDLGAHSRPVTTASPDAQSWFDLGLNWCYGFNHEEGVKCFERALEADPGCAMAHWGVAYGAGPFYNLGWHELGPAEAAAATALGHRHIALARQCVATEVERGLIESLSFRFQKPHAVSPEEFGRWNDDYAAAMRRLHLAVPDDHDVMGLLAEALITRTPRRLWDVKTGRPAPNSDVVEAVGLCERSVAMSEAAGRPPHPAALHMHIHALEMADDPGRAMRSADALAGLCPDAGHMVHMPGHIYVLCGEYEKAKLVSERAIVADELYAAYAGSNNFYVTARCHNLHLMMFTCMFLGQYGPALAAADAIRRIVTPDLVARADRPKLAMTVEGYYAMRPHVLVRFGRWEELIAEPPPPDPDLYPVATAMHHYGRGVALATLKRFAKAEAEQALFAEAMRRMPPGRRFFSNDARAVLGVGEAMLAGELAYHKGEYDAAFAALRESVRRDDDLGYTEPWAWMHPPRHALGALLSEQGRHAEAEHVFRDDLGLSGRIQRCTQHPDNVWALHGLVECLDRRGETAELPDLRRKLDAALGKADVPILSSCMCRVRVAEPAPCCGSASRFSRPELRPA